MKELKKEFTFSELIEFLKGENKSIEIYSSCYYADYTIECINEGKYDMFEPIIGIYKSSYSLTMCDDMEGKKPAMNIDDLIRFYEKSQYHHKCNIDRDVEDGYRFENFEHAILTDTHLVLL